MAIEKELINCVSGELDQNSCFLQKFRLYETRSSFYMIGRDKNRTFWRVLKIDRLEPFELNIVEDCTTYSETECYDLLRRIHEGNKTTGGLKLVTICYGIIGFVRFLGPYYMLLITRRRKIGAICDHTIYAINKSEMIPIHNSTVRSNLAYSKDEKRYKKLLCTMDLTKDFYFSYSYHVMRGLQKNISDDKTGASLYGKMFVWNEFITREIRKNLKNTLWTVALVYGFFKQVDLTVSGRNVKLTLIARRSRHYAGTRYLKRGVNEKGRVANDVETEQIVFANAPDGGLMQISSIVQNRGSIPLFWSQETSRISIKPDIILSKKDHNYEATRLHFENLVKRYGNPIIILNLIKTREKKPRETILRAEFANAIRFINKRLTKENHLRFLHWDLNRHSRSKATNVLLQLSKVAAYALSLTGIFYSQVTPNLEPAAYYNNSFPEQIDGDNSSSGNISSGNENTDNQETEICVASGGSGGTSGNRMVKPPMFQKGVLRTNCIDCLDRTNIAQYVYGLVALGHQLHALGLIESPKIDLDNNLAEDLMRAYETMGDTLALQYGGSAAHNKIFCERRGQWKPATQSQEIFRTLQRFFNNTYVDGVKQDAINVFLGYYQPQEGKPALWELSSDQHYFVGRRDSGFDDENSRTVLKRSLSDSSIVCESGTPVASAVVGCNDCLSDKAHGGGKGISESTPEIPTCESNASYCRLTPSMPHKKLFRETLEHQFLESNNIFCDEHDECNLSNLLDADWLSSSGYSCEEDTYERSLGSLSSEKFESVTNEFGSTQKDIEQVVTEFTRDNIPREFSENFVNWVMAGGSLFF